MNPIGASILLVLLGVIVGGSRKLAALAMLAGVLFLPQAQQISFAGYNLFGVRILGYALFFRVLARGEFSFARLNPIDKAMLLLYTISTAIYCVRADKGTAYVVAIGVDAFCTYFSFRGLVRDAEELKGLLHSFLLILAPFTALVLFDSFTHKNVFVALGSPGYGWIRGGRPRCFGSFRNPDLLGTVGASFFPLFVALALNKEQRKRAYIGILLCLLIVYSCNSGGPTSATAAGVMGWVCWRMRHRMLLVRRMILGFFLLAAIAMKAPVWYLIARISALTGGDGWHRSYLLDVSYRHLSQWWLAGVSIEQTAEWFPYMLATTGGADITNQFLAFGLNAGIGAIVLFVILLKRTFQALGKAMSLLRTRSDSVSEEELILWGLGVNLMTHIVNWFGITYFDQSYALWFIQLAAMSSVSQNIMERHSEEAILQYSPDAGSMQLEPRVQYEPLNN